MKRIEHENCNCTNGEKFDGIKNKIKCLDCDFNKTEKELIEEAFWHKYDLEEAEKTGN